MANDIAANRNSCKPQKLQAKSATVKIRHDSWRKVGRAAGKSRGWWAHACAWRACAMAAVQPGYSG